MFQVKRVIPTNFKSVEVLCENVRCFKTSSASWQSVQAVACPVPVQYMEQDKNAWSTNYHVDKATWDNAKPFNQIPGLKKLPIIGNTWRFLPGGEYANIKPANLSNKLYQDFGEIVKLDGIIGMRTMLYLFNPDDMQAVYDQEALTPERMIFPSITYYRENHKKEFYEDAKGLATSNGLEWYTFRNKVNKIMLSPKAAKRYIRPTDEIAKDFVKRLTKIRNADNVVDDRINKEATKWALESISYMGFDKRLGCFDDDLTPNSLPNRVVKNIEEFFDIAEQLDLRPNIWKYIPTKTFKKAIGLFEENFQLVQGEVTKAFEKIQAKRNVPIENEEIKERSILEKLLEVDEKVARVMTMDMVVAGIDTTSKTFINILYQMTCNPQAQEKLRQEINSVIPGDTEITDQHLANLQYLKACVKEANRMYPVTMGIVRDLTKNSVLHGYQIPKGTTVFLVHSHLSNQASQYPRPDEFIPERWMRDSIGSELSYKNAHPFSSMPFGFGARACIGRRFADMQMELAMINICKKFHVSWKGDPPTKVTATLNCLTAPIGFVFNEL